MQLDWLIDIIGVFGAFVIIGCVIAFVVTGLLLGIALGLVKGQNRHLGSTFVTAFYVALTWLIMLIPIVGFFLSCIVIILQWYIIKSRHGTGWAGAIVAWIITIFLIVIVVIVILFALGVMALSMLWP